MVIQEKKCRRHLQSVNRSLTIAVASIFVQAYAVEVPVPGAGSILQQTQPVKPPVPAQNSTGLTIEQEGRAVLPVSAPFRVNKIELSGNSAFDMATLHALVSEAEGKDLTLTQLETLVSRITDYYHAHGFPLSRAVIPAQKILGGVVHILVIEAHYGKVILDNHSRAYDGKLQEILTPLKSGSDVEQKQYEHVLLLLSDTPGVAVSAVLKPGQTVGTTDLSVQTTATPETTGSLILDNDGNRYTGRARLTGTLSLSEPFHLGDMFSAGVVTTGSDMNYGSLSYDALINGEGTRLGTSFTALHYMLGDTLSALDGHGTAEVDSVWFRHPILRNRDLNLFLRVQYDHQQLDDDIDVTDIKSKRHINSWTATLNGDAHDGWLVGASNAWNVALTSGTPVFDNQDAGLADASTADIQTRFTKLTLNYARVQGLTTDDSLFINLSGQWANHNLDASQKMVAGGPYTVRAYDIGALSGDEGTLETFEFRHNLGGSLSGNLQFVAFYDNEHVTINKTSWVSGDNSATIHGCGFGVSWQGPQQWSAKTYLAVPTGSTPAIVGSNNRARAWLEIDKAF